MLIDRSWLPVAVPVDPNCVQYWDEVRASYSTPNLDYVHFYYV